MTLHSSFHAPHYHTPISSHELPLLTKTSIKSKGSEKCHWFQILKIVLLINQLVLKAHSKGSCQLYKDNLPTVKLSPNLHIRYIVHELDILKSLWQLMTSPSNMFAQRSSLKSTPNVTVIWPSALGDPSLFSSCTKSLTSCSTFMI